MSVARAIVTLAALRVRLPFALALRPLDRVVTSAERGPAVDLDDPALTTAIEVVERWVRFARVVPDTCLYRALARWAVLRRAGRPVRFVMGVREGGADLVGHAWVEEHGAPLGEVLDAAYVVTYVHPASER